MAYVAPSTVTTLQTYTSAAHNIIVNDIIDLDSRINQYAGVYTNEAARDAAITSPTEGMRAYLTAPSATGYASSGDTWAGLPSGVRTVYDGSKWVSITPLNAGTNTAGTTASTSWTATLTSGGTNPSVKLETGTQARVQIYSLIKCAALTGRQVGLSFAVSGATTLSPSGTFGAAGSANGVVPFGDYVVSGSADNWVGLSRTLVITGLTAGINTFALNYITDGGTISYANRGIVVEGIA